ncbi:u-box domain-containing protein 13, partial [Quercus suber]
MLLRELKEYSRSMEDELVSGRPPPYGPICDEALDVMKLLVSHPEGKATIRGCRPVPVLLLLLTIGSPRNKEIVLAILSQMKSDLYLDVPRRPQAKELEQILLDLNKDDITSKEAKEDFNTLLLPFIPRILDVLENGSMEARGDATLTFWSLSTLNDESRETLGASRAIPPLEKTASLTLSELCKYEGNQGLAICAGLLSMLLEELTESSCSMEDRLVSGRIPFGSIFDEALDNMKLLVSHPNGKAAIRDCMPDLLLLLKIGSPINKEIVLAILMHSHLDLDDPPLPQAKEL